MAWKNIYSMPLIFETFPELRWEFLSLYLFWLTVVVETQHGRFPIFATLTRPQTTVYFIFLALKWGSMLFKDRLSSHSQAWRLQWWGCVWFRTNLVNGRIAFQPRIDFSPQSQGWQIINGKHVSTFFNNAQLTVFLFVEHCQSSSLQCTNITINQWQWIGTMILWHIHDKALSQVKNHKKR